MRVLLVLFLFLFASCRSVIAPENDKDKIASDTLDLNFVVDTLSRFEYVFHVKAQGVKDSNRLDSLNLEYSWTLEDTTFYTTDPVFHYTFLLPGKHIIKVKVLSEDNVLAEQLSLELNILPLDIPMGLLMQKKHVRIEFTASTIRGQSIPYDTLSLQLPAKLPFNKDTLQGYQIVWNDSTFNIEYRSYTSDVAMSTTDERVITGSVSKDGGVLSNLFSKTVFKTDELGKPAYHYIHNTEQIISARSIKYVGVRQDSVEFSMSGPMIRQLISRLEWYYQLIHFSEYITKLTEIDWNSKANPPKLRVIFFD